MQPIEIFAQALGIVGMVINILSMQCKKTRGVIAMILVGSSFFGASYFLLGSYAGALMNVFSVFRSVYLLIDKHKARTYQMIVLMTVLIACGADGLYSDGWIALLPLFAQVATTLGMWFRNGAKLRILQITIASPLWLINNALVFAIGGFLCELFVIGSTLISIRRFGWKYLKESD